MTFSSKNKSAGGRRAFTLVELILVMALILIAMALITPKVIGFFEGRALDSEVTRFVALTRYAQSRAVSEGVPMMLWLDESQGTYGLKIQTGYSDKDPKAVDFHLAKGLVMEVMRGKPPTPVAYSQTGRILNGQVAQGAKPSAAIYFSPEGTVIALSSVIGLSIREPGYSAVWIGPTVNRLSYEVQDQTRILANLH